MRKQLYISLLFLFASLTSFSQSQVEFFKKLKTNSVESGHSIVKGFHKNYYVVGVVARGGEDFFVANYDLQGNLIWAKDIASFYTEQGDGVFLENTYDGGLLLGGYRNNKSEVVVVKINSNGIVQFINNRSFNSRLSTSTSAKVFEDGSSIVGGYSNTIGSVISTSQFLMKLDASGNTVWIKNANFPSWGYFCWDVTIDNQEILSSGYATDATKENIYLSRSDSAGNTLWTYRYEGSGKDRLNEIVPDFGCGYIGVGTSTDQLGNKDLLFVKFDQAGNVLLSKTIGGTGSDKGSHIIKSHDGNYVIGGTSNSFSNDQSNNLFLMKVDSVGNVLWTQSYGDSRGQTAIENTSMFTQEADSGFVLTGMDSKQVSGNDFMLIKTDKNGSLNCLSNSASASSNTYNLSKISVQLNQANLTSSSSSKGINVYNSLFVEESICSSIPTTSCGLEANFNFGQNCGSNDMYFYDRSQAANPNYSISVSFGDGNSFSGNQNSGFFTHEYSTSGFYTVNFTISSAGCTSNISKTVYAHNPLGNFSRQQVFCTGDSLDLSLVANVFTQYTWRDNNQNIISTTNKLKVSPTDSTVYYITAIDLRNCCSVNDSVLAIPMDPQKFHLGNDTLLCLGDTLTLEIFGDYNNIIGWQNGSKDSLFLATDTGLYYVSVNTNCGVQTDSIYVGNARQVWDVIGDTLICSSSQYVIRAHHPAILSYKWADGSAADSLLVDTTGIYYLTVSDSYCSYSDSSYVQLFDIEPAVLPDTFYLCQGASDSLILHTSHSSFLWSTGSTKSAIEVSTEGDVWVQISNPCSTYTLNTYVKNFQTNLDIIGDSLVCDLDSIYLTANFPNADILWSTGDTTVSTKVIADGQYSVVVEFSNSCQVLDTSTVQFQNSPIGVLADTLYICVGNDLVLDAAGNLNSGNFLWNTGEITSSIFASTPGLYTVEISNACGMLIDSVWVLESDFTEVLFDTLICDVDSLLLDASVLNAGKYLWSNQDTLAYTYIKNSGQHYVDAFYGNCRIRDSLEVFLPKSPIVDLGSDTSLCQGIQLDATNAQANYSWQDNSTSAFFEVLQSGHYSVTVSNVCGTDSDEINVEVKDCKVIVPNVFTPNSDGIYDEFIIRADYGDWQLEIYNRWGKMLYQSNNIHNSSWDGRDFTGKKCADGIYYVVLKRTDEVENIHSSVLLQH